jgi:hypothetical protein
VAVLARRGEFAAARKRLAVHDPVRDIQNRDLTYEAWADLIAAEGAWHEAPRIVDEARAWADKTGLKFLPAIADRLEGLAAVGTGLPDRGITSLERARATFVELEASWERARTELALSSAQLARGDRAAAAEAAQAALATFAELGASSERAAAEALSAKGS